MGRTGKGSVLSEVGLLIFHPLSDTVTVDRGRGRWESKVKLHSIFIIPQEIEGCDLSEAKGEDQLEFMRNEEQIWAWQETYGTNSYIKHYGDKLW